MAKLKPYKKYKDSGVDWLGEIPDDWKVNRTKVLFKPIDERSKNGSEQLLSVSEHVGVKPRNQLKITMFQAESYEGYKLCQKGDLVINSLWAWKRGLGFSEYSGIVSTAYGVYRPKKSASIDYKFFHYLYRTKKYVDQLYIASRGIWKSRMQLSDSSFLNILVAYPEFETQVKARKYLEYKEKDIDKYIKKLKKEIALLKEHRQKIISQAVTCGLDENGKLRKKPEWSDGAPMPKGWKDSGVEWLGLIPDGWKIRKLKYVVNKFDTKVDDSRENQLRILMENIESSTGRYIPTDDEPLTSKVNCFKKGDVLFGKLRPYLSKVYLAESDGVCVSEFLTLRPKDTTSEYLTHMLLNRDFIYLVNSSTYGAKMPRASWNFIGNVEVSYPDKENQKKISSYIHKFDHQIKNQVSKIQNQIDFIKEYKQSLISKVVTGKIDVRNINNNLSED